MRDIKLPPHTQASPKPGSLTELMRSSPWRTPVTSGLLALNLAAFIVMLMYGAGLWHSSNGVQLAWGANFGPATQDGQWWRLFTALFVHFGIVHLALNMWALWDVGRLVERLYGRLRFAMLYLGSGVVGNLSSLVVQGNQAVSGGASGAIFSLYGALLVFLWRERRQVDRGEFRWLFGAASVFILLILGMGLVVPGIDNAAHAGGLVAGALLGSMLARPWTSESPCPQRLQWVATFSLTLGIAVLVMRVPPPIYLFGEELRARGAILEFLHEDQRISQNWDAILETGRRNGLSFDQLAGSIDANVTTVYRDSFEALRAANPVSAAPSARTLEALQTYASFRANAASDLANGLRANDPGRIRDALELAQKRPAILAP
ncbi:MAG: rhomboid family intramembrane serine protease [Rhodoferax sp.]|uniref:rhomboid family intramembrane serine protease n=1 Tax=Rhodoferax sp. TaxID=50421 RepID=UPI00271B7A5D|nr:rhomboid family intramembrane serine protease [Rhodoferax sp.]MDO8447182.1 rhomboid family intramembrane serine protease [Rhodoferax sp.]